MLAMARAHQALERHDAQEQARNKLTGNPSDGPASAKMITPPDEDTDRPITFS
ncbi:putative type III secretion effector protein [Pseudomonas synxantha BG33R]|nr:putative type III secretion effector protein [Pseudomonas synxantha BG33R]